MKKIKLTQGKYALVSDRDYPRLNKFKWYAVKMGRVYYAARELPNAGGRQKRLFMHRELLGLQHGDRRKGDHRDGDSLNNQRRNLRIANHHQNCHNHSKYSHNTSGFNGVSRHGFYKWKAYIYVRNKYKHLGCFDDPIDAAKAYDKAARKHFGRFARTNF